MDGPAALRKAYLKYGGNVSEPVATVVDLLAGGQTIDQGDSGEVTATPYNTDDQLYTVPVTVGGQTFILDLDTGSSDFWLYSAEINPSKLHGQATFDASKSSTFEKMDGYTFDIGYADGSSSTGYVGTDVAVVGGVAFDKQAFGIATDVSGSFAALYNCDGLLGAGYPYGVDYGNTIKPVGQKTFFANVISTLTLPVFTADLGKTTGSYEFGAIDSSKFVGALMYAPIDTSTTYWEFASPAFKVGDSRWNWPSDYYVSIVVDSGSQFMMLQQGLVDTYYDTVDGAVTDYPNYSNTYVFPCNASLPTLGLAMGDHDQFATIAPEHLIYSDIGNDGMCMGALQYSLSGGPQILGDPFFRSQFVVFDAGNAQVGVA
ncbi:acid protease, partial [Saccharata proteae CBS 121410]